MNSFPENWSPLKVVLSHDWLTGMRGGERVLDLLGRGFPQAPIYTLIHQRTAVSESINAHPIHTSWLQRVPGIMEHYRYFLPVFPFTAERFKLPEADLLISTSHCVAKGVIPRPGTRHLCYCFTPMRYAWTFYGEYFGGNTLKKAMVSPLLAALRKWDREASSRVHRFAAISRHVQQRIKTFYDRDADIVFPPVATDFYTPGAEGHDGFDLIVSALVPYKRIDLAVRAYNRLGYPLVVAGTGTELEKFRGMAASNIRFTGRIPDEAIRDLYRRCRLLVFPGEEDFGIVPVEAQSCGKPVVAYRSGGALETIVDGKTGVFFNRQTEESLLESVEACAGQAWNPSLLRENALRFSEKSFIDGMANVIHNCLNDK
ncbi:MAG: glycosyltransferase [Lentisphaerota bacterium]